MHEQKCFADGIRVGSCAKPIPLAVFLDYNVIQQRQDYDAMNKGQQRVRAHGTLRPLWVARTESVAGGDVM
jgi:hypothetical protein